jgi:hypothetical protein
MVDSLDIKPSDVLIPESLRDYELSIRALHLQVSSLRTNLFILEHLVGFPFGVLAPDQALFWGIVIRNLYFASLTTAWALAHDTDESSLTMSRFRNTVIPRITDASVARTARERLAGLEFEEVRERVRPRIELLRNKVIAHFDRELLAAPGDSPPRLPGVSLSELKELCGVLEGVMNALGFGTHYETLPIAYNPKAQHPVGIDARPDVERLLDDLARSSEYLNMPERKPEEWPFLCLALSDDDLLAINRYRAKCGLKPCTRPAT